MADTPTRRPLSTQQLVELVLDPRDRGYEEAAQRKAKSDRPASRRWYEQPIVAIGCLIIGFILAAAWVHTHRGAPEAAKVHDSLVQRVRSAEDITQGLADNEAKLNGDLSRLQNAALPDASTLVRELNRRQLIAGEVAATGPGLEVRLSEPATTAEPTDVPGHGERTPASGGHILIDRDVRSVVNQLWADGAEAIAVNGIRLTPTSAIRFAGDAVLVDFSPIASPYVIDAIGDADQLDVGFASSDVASRYQTLASAKGIGFSFDVQTALELPAGAVTVPQYATAGTGH